MAVALDPSRVPMINEDALVAHIEVATGWRPTGFCLHKRWGIDEFLMYGSVKEALLEAGTKSRSQMFLYATIASLEEFEDIEGKHRRMTYHALERQVQEASASLKSQPFFRNRILLCEFRSLGMNDADMYRWPKLFNDVAHAMILPLPEFPRPFAVAASTDPRALAYHTLNRRERGDMRPPEMCQWCGVNPSEGECNRGHMLMHFCEACRVLAHEVIVTADIDCPRCAVTAYNHH